MLLATRKSVEDYLRTSYHPDCEYVDGEVLELNARNFQINDANHCNTDQSR
jgi:hypothetical protein